jgi:NADH-quinone oxidoreductase subunit C/D
MGDRGILEELGEEFGPESVVAQKTRDAMPTAWIEKDKLLSVLSYLKGAKGGAYSTLYDLTAIDERDRTHREGQPDSDFTAVYQLLSFDRNEDLRIKVALRGEAPSLPTATGLWKSADFYEREVWDMFGIGFEGRASTRRLLMPPWWEGHPLRKEHPARATEMGRFSMGPEEKDAMLEALRFDSEAWGVEPEREGGEREAEEGETFYLNIGPQHPSAHGVLRLVAKMEGEVIVDLYPDIGYHHRGAEKMGERQSWHTYIPYTDRVDYLAGVMNELPYLLAAERLAGIEVPERAQTIRVMLAELFRIISHLVFYGTFSQDVGQMSPVFYMFNDRERAFDIVEAITGGRMHPGWFRIGGVAMDLPSGWEELVLGFVARMRRTLKDYDDAIMRSSLFKSRTVGIGALNLAEAIEWGATGPFLRACGLEWDLRKKRPYSGYERYDFDVPTAAGGDSYDRLAIHVEEMRQSLRIIEQCARSMPGGPYKSDHPLATPPDKARTMRDIETLIDHFLAVSWGPSIPPGEACQAVEGAKGQYSYYLISDGGGMSYRTRIRTPSFAHIQMTPMMSRGLTVSDLVVVLGSVDYVLADVDR